MPIHPCVGCVYFKECGNTNRTMPCKGRVTKSERKKAYVQERANSYKIKTDLRNL